MIIGHRFELPGVLRNILIIQLGDIGDVVWSIPAFRAVKAAYPAANLHLLLREGIGGLFAADPAIHQVFEVQHYEGSFRERLTSQLCFLKSFRSAGFDLVFDLRSDERGAFMSRLTGAPFRASLVSREGPFYRDRLFTHLVYPTNENVRVRLGATEQTLRIVRQFGIPTDDTIPRVFVSPEIREKMKDRLQQRGIFPRKQEDIQAGFVTVNPFSRWSYKEWPLANWAEIGEWLGREAGLPVVIVGAATEKPRAETLAGSGADANIFNMAGETNLTELAALLSLSRVHVGVDSAAPHIAAAAGTPTITIYGPSDWRDWAPVGDRHQVVTAAMDCSPCYKKGCHGQGRSLCLENMPVDSVKEAIMKAVSPRQ